LVKALNNVWFGDLRVWAKVARFKRQVSKEVRKTVGEGGRGGKGGEGGKTNGEVLKKVGGAVELKKMGKGTVQVEDGGRGSGEVLGRENGDVEGVRVRDVVVRLAGRESNVVATVRKQGVPVIGRVENMVIEEGCVDGKKQHDTDTVLKKFKLIRKYWSVESNLSWARRGVVATVHHGDSIPILQNRIMDAGFNDLNIFPMGADKVFISTTQQLEVMSVINGAGEFFNMLFVNFNLWNKDSVSF